MDTDKTSDAFYDFYFLIHPTPLEEIVLQPGETSDARWVTIPQLEEMIHQGLVAKPIARRFRLHRERLEKLVWAGSQ